MTFFKNIKPKPSLVFFLVVGESKNLKKNLLGFVNDFFIESKKIFMYWVAKSDVRGCKQKLSIKKFIWKSRNVRYGRLKIF